MLDLRHVAVVILALFQLHAACAASTELDEKLRGQATETANAALVFMEIELVRKDGRACNGGIFAKVESPEGKSTLVLTRSNTGIFLNSISFYGGAAVLPAGTYTVGFECSATQKFKGQIARFYLRPGEVINAGRLIFQYDGPARVGSDVNFGIRDLSPKAVASLAERAPNAFSKAKKRHMTLIVGAPSRAGPASPAAGSKQ